MDLLTLLKNSAKSNSAIYIRFLQQYSKQNNYIHVFHEGKEDPSFYGNFIERKTKKNQKIFYYNCRNKQNVYDNYSKLNWRVYKKKRVLFFVDKDYSDILKLSYPANTNIFVTKYYSIENYLVSEAIFARCLRELIGIEDREIEIFSKAFKKGLKRFYKESLILSAYVILHRKNNSRINLNNINLKSLFDLINPFEIRRTPKTLTQLDKQCGVNTKGCYSEIREIVKNLQKITEPKKYVRGKYELEFLVYSVNFALEMINKSSSCKYKMSVSFANSNAIQIIAPRLRQPIDIGKFLNSNLQ